MSNSHVDRIREQFTRQGEAYARLEYVSDDRGLAALLKVSDASESDVVLDVACGPGFIAMAFGERCAEAVGVDATDAFLSMAREEAGRRGLKNVRFVQGNVESLDFPDASFDIAVCRAAFHHFPDPGKVLGEMARVVKTGGRLLVLDMVASEITEKAAYHHRIEVLCDPTHAKALRPSEFASLFEEAGLVLESEREGQTNYSVETWIAHGGPSETDAATLRELLAACVDSDRAGIPVWQEEDVLMMAHISKSYLLKKPA